jgi:hypothetical protein
LEQECDSKYGSNPAMRQLCDDIAQVFVQIPPSLFQGMDDLAWPAPEALCATLYQCYVDCCGADDPPEQVHLSIASNDTSTMAVTWVTLKDKLSIVQYGTNKKLLNKIATGSISTYRAAGKPSSHHRRRDLSP